MKTLKDILLRDFSELCKTDEVKHEFTQLMKPVIQFLFQELYPYIFFSLMFIIICFILILFIFIMLFYQQFHRFMFDGSDS